jgi:hypothetical protein
LLLATIVLAASVKSYSLYATTLDVSELTPAVIISGQAQAPNQYRLLFPVLWKIATSMGIDAQAAEQGLVIGSIVFCYTVLAAVLFYSSRSIPVTALCLLAFYGAAASGFWFRYRDTFLEVGLTCVGMHLVVQRRPAWSLYALVSAVAALNRETWLFSLVAGAVSRWSASGVSVLAANRRRDILGLVAAAVLAVGVLVGIRAHYGIRAYHYELWQFQDNARLLLLAESVKEAAGQAVWFAGSGMFAVWLIFAISGRVQYAPFVVGFAGSLLGVSFLISNWSETRIFLPAYAVMLVSISAGLASGAGEGLSSQT